MTASDAASDKAPSLYFSVAVAQCLITSSFFVSRSWLSSSSELFVPLSAALVGGVNVGIIALLFLTTDEPRFLCFVFGENRRCSFVTIFLNEGVRVVCMASEGTAYGILE